MPSLFVICLNPSTASNSSAYVPVYAVELNRVQPNGGVVCGAEPYRSGFSCAFAYTVSYHTADRSKALSWLTLGEARRFRDAIVGWPNRRIEEIPSDSHSDHAIDLHDREIGEQDREAARDVWSYANEDRAIVFAAREAAACAKQNAAPANNYLRNVDALRARIESDTRLLGRPSRHTTITEVRNTALHLLGMVSAYACIVDGDKEINDGLTLRNDVTRARDAALGTFITHR